MTHEKQGATAYKIPGIENIKEQHEDVWGLTGGGRLRVYVVLRDA